MRAQLCGISRTSERSGLWAPPTEGDDQAVVEPEIAHRTLSGLITGLEIRARTPGPERADPAFPSSDIEQPEHSFAERSARRRHVPDPDVMALFGSAVKE